MSNPKIARAFLLHHLPASIIEKIDIERLEGMPGSFIDESLKGWVTDILYKTTFNKEEGYIYLLIEHQRKSDPLMPLRLLEYTIQIFRRHIKKHDSAVLPLVYPVVLYNGSTQYSHSTDIFDMFQDPQTARDVFLKPFQLIDLTQVSDDDLKKNVLLGAMELFLKHAYARDLVSFLTMMGDLLREIDAIGELDFLESGVYYLFATNRDALSRRAILEEFKKQLSPPTQEKVMTIAEAFIQDGIEEGLQRGLQQGRQEGRQEGFRNLLEKQVRRRFPKTVTAHHLYLMAEADSATLAHWGEKLMEASQIEDVFSS